MKKTLGPRICEGDASAHSSFPRDRQGWRKCRKCRSNSSATRESSVVGILRSALAVTLLSCPFPSFAQEWVSLEKTTGAELFGEKCGMCHRAGGMGTGILGRRMTPELALLENRRDLQAPFIETVTRSGFGVMFPISRGEVSDAQLQTIIKHLTDKNAQQERAP